MFQLSDTDRSVPITMGTMQQIYGRTLEVSAWQLDHIASAEYISRHVLPDHH